MAFSGGRLHQMVTKNLKIFKTAWGKSTSHLLESLRHARSELQPVYVRQSMRHPLYPLHPLHPTAFLRQSKGRSYVTRAISAVRNYSTAHSRSKSHHHSSLTPSRIVSTIARLPGRAPFATALRPNMTGGTLGRTASGYTLGAGRIGGARYFTHGPAASAEVIQKVSQSIRAFCISGQKAQYSGSNARGEKRFDVVGTLKRVSAPKLAKLSEATPGSFVEFAINPTITAIAPVKTVTGVSACPNSQKTLKSQGFLDVLSVDFSRAVKDLAAILHDINSLSNLGDLPISYHRSTALRVHFPGCDALSVENLCAEIGVRHGIVVQDEDFEDAIGTKIALLFPFAPDDAVSDCDNRSVAFNSRTESFDPVIAKDDWQHKMRSDSGLPSVMSNDRGEVDELSDVSLGFLEEYESVHSQSQSSDVAFNCSPSEYQDVEGIQKFIELCDSAKR